MAARVSIYLCFFFTVVAFQSAHADCLRESSGQTVCGQGPCDKDRSGKVFCATERYGSAVRNQQGEVVCGLGGCLKDMYGQIQCSSVAGGNATKGIDGVKCVGGCEPATPAHCERMILE